MLNQLINQLINQIKHLQAYGHAILDREVEKSERSLEFSPIPGPSKVREFEPSNHLF